MDNGKGGNTTLGFLLGLFAGGMLGILFAPKAGKETREELQHMLSDIETKVGDKKKEIQEASAKHLAEVKEEISNTFKKEKEA